MKWLIENEIIPYLRQKFDLKQVIHYKLLKVSDLGESNVDHLIGHLIAESTNPTVGVLAHPGQVDVRIAAMAEDTAQADKLIEPVALEARRLLGDNVFAEDDETMESTVGALLESSGRTVACYEDLSGGSVAAALGDAAGPLFIHGMTVNSNAALEHFAKAGGEEPPFSNGEERSAALARAARKFSDADIGISAHGVAEGDQRIENLGRGETFIAIASEGRVASRHVRSAGRGAPDRRRAALSVLSLLRRELLGLPAS